MTLYVVGIYIEKTESGAVWEFQGVFDSVEKAEKACIKNNFFVAEAELNEELPAENTPWPKCYYPKSGDIT